MSLAQEKKLIKEIEQIKQSKKTAAQYVTQEEVTTVYACGYHHSTTINVNTRIILLSYYSDTFQHFQHLARLHIFSRMNCRTCIFPSGFGTIIAFYERSRGN